MIRVLGLALLVLAAPAGKPKPPAPAPRPPPKVDVTLSATTPTGGWAVKVTNSGTVPVRIVADAALLDLDVTAPGGGAKVHCALPSDMVPLSDMERGLVLVPGRSYTERFDPRLYCFSEREVAALVPGATVAAHYGFGARSTSKAFVPLVAQDDPAAPGPAKSIDAAPLTLPALPAPAAAPPVVPAVTDGIKLVPTVTPRIDLERTFERQVTVSVRNAGPLAVRSLFTSATVGFLLVGPDGATTSCGAALAPTPIPELLTTLAPGARTNVTIGLALCPSAAFRMAGLYQLRPRVDTRRVGYSTVSLYRGEVLGEPSLLRLHVSTSQRPLPQVDPP